MSQQPLITVGMFIYNEERHIEESIASVLNQDYRDFQLIISDNASTDRCGDICRAHAAKDSRITYRRHPENVGALENFNGLARECQSRYFASISGHDVWEPGFLSKCLAVLEAESNVVLAYPRAYLINHEGAVLGVMPGKVDTRGGGPMRRLRKALWGIPNGNPISGVLRTEALRKTSYFARCVSTDFVLFNELALLGEFACVDEPLWRRRETHLYANAFDVIRWQQGNLSPAITRGRGIISPYLRLIGMHFVKSRKHLTNPLQWLSVAISVFGRYFVIVPYRWLWKRQTPWRVEERA